MPVSKPLSRDKSRPLQENARENPLTGRLKYDLLLPAKIGFVSSRNIRATTHDLGKELTT
jgi:hypothetical protein